MCFSNSKGPGGVLLQTLRVAHLGEAERAASVVRLQAAELVKWRFRNGQVLASLDQLMSWARRIPGGKGKAMHRKGRVGLVGGGLAWVVAGWAGPEASLRHRG